VTDAHYEVVEDRYPLRIRFWPTVLFWAAVIAMGCTAQHFIPNAPEGYVPLYVTGAALLSPLVRLICYAFSGPPQPSEQAEQLLRQRLSNRARGVR
jgi:hypothetical protein